MERERKAAQRKQEGDRAVLKEDEMWRLDAPLRIGGRRGKVAELIDDRGKVRLLTFLFLKRLRRLIFRIVCSQRNHSPSSPQPASKTSPIAHDFNPRYSAADIVYRQ